MDFVKIDKEIALQSVPEDIKRYIIREIEKLKISGLSINYQYAHHLVSKHEALMDFFVASESTASEMEEIKKTYTFYIDVVHDNRNEIAICVGCKKIVGVFKNTFTDVSFEEFVRYVVTIVNSCPSCGPKGCIMYDASSLIDGIDIVRDFSRIRDEPPPKIDEKNAALELYMITALWGGFCEDFKQSIRIINAAQGNNSLKDFIIHGRIQGLAAKLDDGSRYGLFGKVSQEIPLGR